MHDAEFDHEHLETSVAARKEAADFIWLQEHIHLKTVGIDIGSSTSHLLFAEVLLQREPHGLSSKFRPVRRDIVWRSPIWLTPFLPDGTIDADALGGFIAEAYEQAGFSPAGIDSGAVILTGEAIKRRNARAIDHMLAEQAGKFVCATAGHELECKLSAHGSGAVALSRKMDTCLLNVDIGGGTTKLALVDRGHILGVWAFAAGGRLVASDTEGKWTYVTAAARDVAADLGLSATPGSLPLPETRQAIAARLAEVIVDNIIGAPPDALGHKLQLTEPFRYPPQPEAITVSGGVAEYIFGRETQPFGDIALELARSLGSQFAARLTVPVLDPGQGIRATVIGASQHVVQVSGKTTFLPVPALLPRRNIPVIAVDAAVCETDSEAFSGVIARQIEQLASAPDDWAAVAFKWAGEPEYGRIRAVAEAVLAGVPWKRGSRNVLAVVIDGDVGKTMGNILTDDLAAPWRVIAVDGVQLQEFDYLDLGQRLDPPGVIPVVVKSLLFADTAPS